MCGLTGFLGDPSSADSMVTTLRRMRETLAHRGPDDTGEWTDAGAGYAIGFRRLAIVDLTPAGHQPMTSASGRYVIAFNGEIYNYETIRAELREAGLAPAFRGHSDTEVMLAAFEAWGVEAAVKRFIGMFAIALWDRRERRLHLVRDRMGVKPMYYGRAGNAFVFGSELKALRAHDGFDNAVDPVAVSLYLKFAYVPAPLSIYKGISKVLPGTIVTVDAARNVSTTVYWSVRGAAERGIRQRFSGSERDATDELDRLLRDSVALRMIADVPLGVFLSGGVDSSVVTALMQAQSARPVKTFSIGFTEESYDEARYAKSVASHLGTEHTEAYVTWSDALDVVPKLPAMYDEPFADSSQIPTHLVSAIARRSVTVSLSGDGGDELFAGYNRYFVGHRLWRRAALIPRAIRPAMGRLLRSVPTTAWDRLASAARPILPRSFGYTRPGEGIHKFSRVLGAADADQMYFEVMSYWKSLGAQPDPALLPVTDRAQWPKLDDPVERMMFLDQISYLPDDILVKVDRASMAVSLEAREPLLDHRLVEFAWSLPLQMKLRDGKGKWILRQVLRRYVPEQLIERPKMGFGVPIDQWLRGPLRDWAESLLDERTLREQGLFAAAPVRERWRAHLSGSAQAQHDLWAVLMLQAWLEETRPRVAAAA